MIHLHIHRVPSPDDHTKALIHYLAYHITCNTGYNVLVNGTETVSASLSDSSIQTLIQNKMREKPYPKTFLTIHHD